MFDDRAGGLAANLIGKLNRIGVDSPLPDRLLTFRLAIEADHHDVISSTGFLHGSTGAQRRRVIDSEDAVDVWMCLQRVLGRLVPAVWLALAGQLCNDRDLARLAVTVMLLD